MAFSKKAVFCFSARLVAFVAMNTGIFSACAALPQAAQAQAVFEGEKRAQRNETDWGLKGEITGRVLLDDGKPAVGFVVRADFSRGHTGALGEGSAITDAQGNYRIHGLRSWAEPFRVQVENVGTGYIAEPARLVEAHLPSDPPAEPVNFTLRLGPQITVRVRDAETGEPVAGIVIESENSHGFNHREIGKTGVSGDFVFRADELDADIELNRDVLRTLKIGAAPGYFSFNRLRLPKIADTVLDVKTYKNPYTHPDVIFRGVILNKNNKPISGATVRLARDNAKSETTSDSEGRFAFRSKRVEGPEVWAGVITVEKDGFTTTIYPTAEQTWDTMTIRLAPAIKKTEIKGQAVSASGKPMAGVPVSISRRVPTRMTANSFFYLPREQGGVTDSSGYFSIKGLPEEAEYELQFGNYSPSGRGALWGKSYFPERNASHRWLRLQNNETRDIGQVVVYPADAVIAGHVVSPSIVVMRELLIVVEGKHFNASITPDDDGNFRFPNVVREPLKLGVYVSLGDGRGWNTQRGNLTEVCQGTVRAGDTNLTIDLTYDTQERSAPIKTP